MPQVDRADPAAGYLATFAGLDSGQRAAALSGAVSGDAAVPAEVATSAETRLALARAQLDVGDYDGAGVTLAELAAEDPSDWRIAWTDGLRWLAAAADAAADGLAGGPPPHGAFSAVYDELPGELAPKLALGFAAEAAGDAASAARYFQLVWTVDRSCISAAFGLARACLAADDRPGAIAALAAVPETSSHHAAAQIAAVRILVSSGVTGDDLRQANGRLGRLPLDEARRQQLTVEILRAALGWAAAARPGHGQAQVPPGPRQRLRRRPHPRLRTERALTALRPGTRIPGAGPADLGPQPPDRAGRHGQRGPAEDLVMTRTGREPKGPPRVRAK